MVINAHFNFVKEHELSRKSGWKEPCDDKYLSLIGPGILTPELLPPIPCNSSSTTFLEGPGTEVGKEPGTDSEEVGAELDEGPGAEKSVFRETFEVKLR